MNLEEIDQLLFVLPTWEQIIIFLLVFGVIIATMSVESNKNKNNGRKLYPWFAYFVAAWIISAIFITSVLTILLIVSVIF